MQTQRFEGRGRGGGALLGNIVRCRGTPCMWKSPPRSHLIHHGGHELRVGLLVRQELPDDLVHDVLGREEVV